MSKTYRVIQWATGTVGAVSLRHIIENPDYELAGVLVYNPDKSGKDAGADANGPGSAEHVHALAAQFTAARTLQKALHGRHQRRRRGDRAAGIGKHGNFERRHHRRARALQHVHGEAELAPPDEDAGLPCALGAA